MFIFLEYLVLNESPVDTIDKRKKISSVGNRNKLLKTQSMQVDHTSLSPEIQPPQKSKSVDLTSLNEEDEELAGEATFNFFCYGLI